MMYMVEFEVPTEDFDLFSPHIPDQMNIVSKMMSNGVILSYTLSTKRDKLWMIALADAESELLHIINDLPLTPFLFFTYHELLFHDTLSWQESICLN